MPNQGLYSLGGSRSIRGIGAEEQLARNIFLVRTELRQDIFPELDLNLLDLLVLRRQQIRLFADTGQVDNSAGRIYDVGRWALGVGVGLAAVYDFMGFFPSSPTSRSPPASTSPTRPATCSSSSARASPSEHCPPAAAAIGLAVPSPCPTRKAPYKKAGRGMH